MIFELVPNASTWLQEFKPYVNGKETQWDELKLNLVAGEECNLTLDYRYSWLIGDADALIALQFKAGSPRPTLEFDPPLGALRSMEEGSTSLSWIISTEGVSTGGCELEFAMPFMKELPFSPPIVIDVVNIEQELEVKFDSFEVALEKGAAMYPCHGARHTFTVKPKAASRLLNRRLRLVWEGDAAAELGIIVTPSVGDEFLLTEAGIAWTLDCRSTARNGDFSLRVAVAGSSKPSTPLSMLLGHNLVTAERWVTRTEPYPGEPNPIIWYHILAKSSFLKIPVEGVRVAIILEQTVYENTNRDGEVVTRSNSFRQFQITNGYDGSVV